MDEEIVGGRRTSRRRHPGSSASFGITGRALQGTLYSKQSRKYEYRGTGADSMPGGTVRVADGVVPFFTREFAEAADFYTVNQMVPILYATPEKIRGRIFSWKIKCRGVIRNETNQITHLYAPCDLVRSPHRRWKTTEDYIREGSPVIRGPRGGDLKAPKERKLVGRAKALHDAKVQREQHLD